MPALPFKLNQDRRRHIPEQKRKVTNWRDYDESLRRRGSLTVWFSDEAVEAWEAERRTSRGGQPEYSDLAILTALTFKAVFRLAYRQTEGLIGSVIGLLGIDLAVPDHTTLCRRAETLEVPRPKPRGDGADSGGPEPHAGAGTPDLRPHHLNQDRVGVTAPASLIRAPSVDAPFRARGNFRTVVARGRMLPSVRPLVRQRTAAGLYGSSRTGSKSQPRTRGTVVHTGYPDPVSPTVAPCRPSARPTPSRRRRVYAAGAGAR